MIKYSCTYVYVFCHLPAACDSTCATCSANSAGDCLSCDDNRFLSSSTCIRKRNSNKDGRRSANAGLILAERWAKIKPVLGQGLVSSDTAACLKVDSDP